MISLKSNNKQQRGAALAVSLILLLVMTVVGVAAMNGARLEIAMAGLMQDEQVALRRGERTQLEAQDRIDQIVASDTTFEFHSEEDEEDGLYAPDETTVDDAATTRDWSGIDFIEGPQYTDNSKDDDDAMVIQYLGTQTIPGGDLSIDGEDPIAGEEAHVYRITTRSTTDGKSMRIIESIYTTFEGP